MAPSAQGLADIRFIPLYYNNADSHNSALELILTLRPEWKKSQDTIDFVRFTDGITNTLLKATNKLPGLSHTEIDNEAVLLRAYGKGTDVLIDRENESLSHSFLAQHGLAPSLLARFENGLLYKFIQGNVCSPADLRRPEVWRGVARKLGEWHATLSISSITDKDAVPGRENGNGTNGSLHKPNSKRTSSVEVLSALTPGKPFPNVWTVTQKWMLALPTATAAEKARKEQLQRELEWLVDLLADTPGLTAEKQYVFAHCDLLSGNVIVQAPSNDATSVTETNRDSVAKVSFIDYEYTTAAPASFDIANHFAEWGGFDCDFTVLPTRAVRRAFLKDYLNSFNQHLDRPFKEAELDQLFGQVDQFRGVPGFYWGIWALIQAQISLIDFDYANYAEVRLSEYWAWKKEFLGQRVDGEEQPVREKRWAQEH